MTVPVQGAVLVKIAPTQPGGEGGHTQTLPSLARWAAEGLCPLFLVFLAFFCHRSEAVKSW